MTVTFGHVLDFSPILCRSALRINLIHPLAREKSAISITVFLEEIRDSHESLCGKLAVIYFRFCYCKLRNCVRNLVRMRFLFIYDVYCFFFFCIFRLNVSCVYSSRGCNLCVILIFGESSKKYVLKLR